MMAELDLCVCLQDFHGAEAPEGSVHQATEAVPLHLERAKSVEAVEGQALHTADTIPAQLSGATGKKADESSSQRLCSSSFIP